MRSIPITEFKAKCLAIIEKVAQTGEPVTIVKRGKVLGRVVAAPEATVLCPQNTLRGTVKILGDITAPVMDPDIWDAVRGEWEPNRSNTKISKPRRKTQRRNRKL